MSALPDSLSPVARLSVEQLAEIHQNTLAKYEPLQPWHELVPAGQAKRIDAMKVVMGVLVANISGYPSAVEMCNAYNHAVRKDNYPERVCLPDGAKAIRNLFHLLLIAKEEQIAEMKHKLEAVEKLRRDWLVAARFDVPASLDSRVDSRLIKALDELAAILAAPPLGAEKKVCGADLRSAAKEGRWIQAKEEHWLKPTRNSPYWDGHFPSSYRVLETIPLKVQDRRRGGYCVQTYFVHTPGEEMPCGPDEEVVVRFRGDDYPPPACKADEFRWSAALAYEDGTADIIGWYPTALAAELGNVGSPANTPCPHCQAFHDPGRCQQEPDLTALHAKGAAAWKDVPDATKWVEEIRGGGVMSANKTETFEHGGKTWTRHKPGDPCPVDGEMRVFVMFKNNIPGCSPVKASLLAWCHQTIEHRNIIGYRLADAPAPQEPEAKPEKWAAEKAAWQQGQVVMKNLINEPDFGWETVHNVDEFDQDGWQFHIMPGMAAAQPESAEEKPAEADTMTLALLHQTEKQRAEKAERHARELEAELAQARAAWEQQHSSNVAAIMASEERVKGLEKHNNDLFQKVAEKAEEISRLEYQKNGAESRVKELEGQVSSIRTDRDSYRELASKNGDEANALRRAAGVDPDMTIGEGIDAIAEMKSRLALLTPRLMSQKPTREDANPNGVVTVVNAAGDMSTIHVDLWDRVGDEWKHWLPFPKEFPPPETMEERERREFEAECTRFDVSFERGADGRYSDSRALILFEVWMLRAGKERA